MVNGFLTICAGVVLLQLSKSAKDVPDAAVFSGDLDQIHTIAEQPQPETEPKADAIRGTAAIVRRLSSARQKMELDELKRIREEKLQESLEPVNEDGVPQYQWDGIRRRRTGTFSSYRSTTPRATHLAPPTPHLPLGWSHFPTEEELAEANRPVSPALSSIVGTIRGRARSILLPGHPDLRNKTADPSKVQSPMHPVQLTSIAVAVAESKPSDLDDYTPPGTSASNDPSRSGRRVQFGEGSRNVSDGGGSDALSQAPPTPPPHSARRQFSFQHMFRRNQAHAGGDGPGDEQQQQQPPTSRHGRPSSSRHGLSSRGYSTPQIRGATEEETLGLVKGDSNSGRQLPPAGQYDDSDEDEYAGAAAYRDDKQAQYGHSITKGYSAGSPPRGQSRQRSDSAEQRLGLIGEDEVGEYEKQRTRFEERRRSGGGKTPSPPPPPPPPHGGSDGAAGFI